MIPNLLHLAQLLIKRQIEIASCLCEGNTDRQIAEALHISYNTVRTHHSKIRDKLGVHSIQELMRTMFQYGFIPGAQKITRSSDKNHTDE